MVYAWLQNPPLNEAASLVVAEIDAPIGINTRFEQDLENHLYEVLRANPKLTLQLVHCSLCRQWIAVSKPRRTVIGRALNQPEGLAEFSQFPHRYALSLHFDVINNDLLLWAEIYEIAAPQRVVWAQRFAQSTSARTILREPTHLVSINEARLEQTRLIAGRDTLSTVTRFPIRIFSGKSNDSGKTEIPPLIFLEQAFEASVSPHNDRRAGLALGITSIKGSMQGWSLGTYFQQLLLRPEPSLSQPDLYLHIGVNYLRLEGPGAAVFGGNQIDVNHLVNTNDDPRASLTTFQVGLEAHVKYRFGFSAFLEYIPALDSSQLISTQHLLIPFHSIGVAGMFLW